MTLRSPISILFTAIALVFTLSACSSKKISPQANQLAQTPEGMSSLQANDEPCWIRSPDCAQQHDKEYVYFVGQSDKSYPSAGRPDRVAFSSAQKDAEFQYAKYLGVYVSSDMILYQHESKGQTASQIEEVLQETVAQRISDLKKADQYYVSNAINSHGERLWTVYILLKINKADIDKHRNQMISKLETKRPKIQFSQPKKKASEVSSATFFYGVWEGAGIQDSGSSWTIRVELSESDKQIAYPSLKCKGNLTLIEETQNKMLFHETLSRGDGCISGGRTAITLVDANTAMYKWYYPNGKPGGEGSLKKVQ